MNKELTATAILGSILEAIGPEQPGEPCPVCHTYQHRIWCWAPLVWAWARVRDDQNAAAPPDLKRVEAALADIAATSSSTRIRRVAKEALAEIRSYLLGRLCGQE